MNKPAMKEQRSPKTRELLQNASDMLDVARNLAPLIPVPVLCSIFMTAKAIIDVSIKMRQDKREAAELAEYAASLTSNVHRTVRGKEHMIDKDLSLSLNQLSSVLDDIRTFMDKQVALRFWERLFIRSEVSERLVEYKSRLEYIMQTFITTSSLRQEMGIKYLKDGMDDLKETLQSGQTSDDQFRIYRWGDIEIVRPHNLPFGSCLSDIETFDAKIEGQLKVVKVYRDQNVFLHSRNLLSLVRESPRLPFAQLEGYTIDCASPFIVLKGGLTNMFEYLSSLNMMDYFVERLRFMIDMKSAMIYLASQGFRWKGWIEKLMISESGRLAIGYADDIVRRLDTDSDGGTSRIMISWPKLGIAEGLHVLVERPDDILSPLYSALERQGTQYDLDSLSHLWGRYVDELNCGITSFVTVTNSHPPPLGSIGFLRATDDGVRFDILFSSYTGTVNVRTTGQIRPGGSLEDNGEDIQDGFDARDWRNFEGEDISMPLLLTEETSLLLSYRTSYSQLHGQSRVVEHLVRSTSMLPLHRSLDIESLVIVSGVIERASATFSRNAPDSPSSNISTLGSSTLFHPHPPDERGFMRQPWGFLSNTAVTSTDTVVDSNDMSDEWIHEKANSFQLALGEITAHTEQRYKLYCFQFSPAEAEAVRHMYKDL